MKSALCCISLLLFTSAAQAWVQGDWDLPFPDGEIKVIGAWYCINGAADCDNINNEGLSTAIGTSLALWRATEADFQIQVYSPPNDVDGCQIKNHVVYIYVGDTHNVCPGDTQPTVREGIEYLGWYSQIPRIRAEDHAERGRYIRIYFRQAEAVESPTLHEEDDNGWKFLTKTLVHEFGHVLGLDHPDDHGQDVVSIMNRHNSIFFTTGGIVYAPTKTDDGPGVQAIYGYAGPPEERPAPKYALGIPGNNSIQSGVGIISGWTCEAEEILILIQGEGFRHVLEPSYGVERTDTESVCGDADNGFITQVNWGNYSSGEYLVSLYIDDELDAVAEHTITIVKINENESFMTGLQGRYRIPDFPEAGKDTIIEWNQSLQNFSIVEIE